MANSKKLRKAAAKFRKTEPALHSLYSNAIRYMAYLTKKLGSSKIVVQMHNGAIVDAYADE